MFESVGAWLRNCRRCYSFWGATDLYCKPCWDHIFSSWELSPNYCYRENKRIKVSSLWQWGESHSTEVRAMIMALKGGGLTQANLRLARLLSMKDYARGPVRAKRGIIFIPAPSRGRGKTDHALSLAKALASQLDAKWLDIFKRVGHQEVKGLGREKRKQTAMVWDEGVEIRSGGSVIVVKDCEYRLDDYRVIFVDDVVTSGATAGAAKALLAPLIDLEVWCLVDRPMQRKQEMVVAQTAQ